MAKTERESVPKKPQPPPNKKGPRGLDSMLTHVAVLALVDLGLGLGAYFVAWLCRLYLTLPLTENLLPQERWAAVGHPWITLLASQLFLLYIMGMYDDMRSIRIREIVGQVFIVCVLQVAVVTSLFYFTEEVFPRTVILIFDVFNLIFLCLWRIFVKKRLGGRIRRTLVVSPQPAAASEIIRNVEQNPWMGLVIAGLVVDQPGSGEDWCGYPVLGSLEEISSIVSDHEVEEIIVASEPSWRDEILDKLSQVRLDRRLGIAILPSVYDMVVGKLRHVNIHDTPLIEVTENPNEPLERFVKRAFDVAASAVGLIVWSPVLLLVALVIKLSSRGPVFYRQERVGKGGRSFELIKFRTMVRDAERDTGATFSSPDDPRITGIGRLLRRSSLDELPQLLNVLKGDMSFVGPRPERPEFVRDFLKEVAGYGERHKVKPGITGLAQVRAYYHTRAENKLKYDLAYIYNYSFSIDLLILLETLKVILSRKDRVRAVIEEPDPAKEASQL